MTDEKCTSSSNSNLLTYLAVLFIGLKLTGYIDWSWWIVVSPLWVPFVFGLVLLVVYYVAVFIDTVKGK